MILIQAIRNAMVNDLVVRNVVDLAAMPAGKPGRPSKSLNLDQALAVLDAAKGERLWPYVAVSMLGGIRAEEARGPALVRGGPRGWHRGRLPVSAAHRRDQDREVAARVPDRGDRRRGAARSGPEAGGRPGEGRDGMDGEQPGILHEPREPNVADRCPNGVQADHRKGGPRPELDAGGSCGTPLSRSCRILVYPSSRSPTRRATPALAQPRSSTDTSSGRLRVPRPVRWGRCSRAEERPMFESRRTTNGDQS
jgi:hypothetical protein